MKPAQSLCSQILTQYQSMGAKLTNKRTAEAAERISYRSISITSRRAPLIQDVKLRKPLTMQESKRGE